MSSAPMVNALDLYRVVRDSAHETLFETEYGNPWLEWFYSGYPETRAERPEEGE